MQSRTGVMHWDGMGWDGGVGWGITAKPQEKGHKLCPALPLLLTRCCRGGTTWYRVRVLTLRHVGAQQITARRS